MNQKLAARMSVNACQQCHRASICLLSSFQQTLSEALNAFQFQARVLQRGEHLCRQGETSDCLYIVRTGVLKSYVIKPTGEEYVMGFYFSRDLRGGEGIDDYRQSVSVCALDQSNICIIPTEKMFALTQSMPALGSQLLRMVSRRIQQDNIALLRTTADQRVATFLLQLALRYEQLGFPNHRLQLVMTHHDIANYLRITPSTISRIFHAWQKENMIRIVQHTIHLLDIARMHAVANS